MEELKEDIIQVNGVDYVKVSEFNELLKLSAQQEAIIGILVRRFGDVEIHYNEIVEHIEEGFKEIEEIVDLDSNSVKIYNVNKQ